LFKHVAIGLTTFIGIQNSLRMLYNTPLLINPLSAHFPSQKPKD
jgi:hypothetical protein